MSGRRRRKLFLSEAEGESHVALEVGGGRVGTAAVGERA